VSGNRIVQLTNSEEEPSRHGDGMRYRTSRPPYWIAFAVFSLITGIWPVYSAVLERNDDPPVRELRWNVVETDHFRIHYTDGLERVAATVADLGDRIYEPITSLYQYEPPGKTDIILRDHGDIANGFAAYFQNRVEIWASNLDYEYRSTHDWLRDVFTHEYTHIVQLGSAKKAPSWLPQLYLQYFRLEPEYRSDVAEGLPNALASFAIPTVQIPMWFAEGVAQYQVDPVRADWWDPHRDMILRTAVLNDAVLSYRKMEGFYDHDGREAEMVYDHGYAFVRWLCASYGDVAVRKMTAEMTKWTVWRFDRAIKVLTGKPGPEVYTEWVAEMRVRYGQLVDARQATIEGELIDDPDGTESDGTPVLPLEIETGPDPWSQSDVRQIVRRMSMQDAQSNTCSRCMSIQSQRSNLYHAEPSFSPDGTRLAFVSTDGQDYHLPTVVVKTLGTDTTVTAPKSYRASSSVAWFPDGERIVFSRAKRDQSTGWRYDDLIITDLADEESTELTKGWRARYPSVSPDGTKIIFVRNEAGSTNLWLAELDTSNLDSSALRPLTDWTDGTQIFRPIWSPDGKHIAASIARAGQRDVVIYRVAPDGSLDVKRVFASSKSDRDPAWSADGSTVVFTSAQDGIFNLYEGEPATGRVDRLTNTVGGAFTPGVAPDGRIAYSSYEIDGHVIRMLPADQTRVPMSDGVFTEPLTPAGTFSESFSHETSPENRTVPQFIAPALLPRVGIYGDRIRLGAYGFTGDLWDTALLLGGFWVAPSNLDYDAFLLADFTNERLRWPLSLELARTVRYTEEDTLIAGKLGLDGIEYGLNSVQAALKPSKWSLDFDLHAMYQRYDAAIDQTVNLNGAIIYVGYNYTYYKGSALGLTVSQRAFAPYTTREINPQGYRWSVRYDRWWNNFFEDFDSNNSGLLSEQFTHYNYNQVTFDGALYLGMPWHEEHTIGVETRAMLIDAKTDSFFYEGIGGIIGLRGYTYYQLQGNRTAWARMMYRLPLLTDIDRALGPIYFDKIYFSAFAEAGRVWRDQYENGWISGIKRDVGVELRTDLFAFYGYPSRLSVAYAHALDAAPNTDRRKWYLTLLFGYL
jgi:Tol biopolymer transport system component